MLKASVEGYLVPTGFLNSRAPSEGPGREARAGNTTFQKCQYGSFQKQGGPCYRGPPKILLILGNPTM